ncbi:MULTISPECIES: primosomal protein N' [Brachybacterium]|uniref:Probable replication restart protein PriA n=1 Tax=Brachybacterium conglomeratum TaxID=47846 RepID=A0ABQ5RHL3_9MICO|nr:MULTISPECIES: primosomal protein N' [Brachybacterium]GLI31370.1 primosomal protein N' [Brachybacterium conglomeratum]GLK04282.1 primosomal protein N' [Brachybacterium conglomeratum]
MRPGGGAQALTSTAHGAAGEREEGPADGQAPLFAAPAASVPAVAENATASPDRPDAVRGPGLRTTAGFEVVSELPVASVRLVGVLPHLDRPFEYAVTPDTAAAGPGMRVRVRFSGKDTEGIVLERRAEPTTDRALAPLHRLVSDDVVVPPTMMRVCEDVAERSAGTIGDVLRLALPPRHARAEKADRAAAEKEEAAAAEAEAEAEAAEDLESTESADDAEPAATTDAGETGHDEQTVPAAEPSAEAPVAPRHADRYPGLAALLSRAGSAEGPVPRASLVLDPVDPWTAIAAESIAALGPDRGALVIAPDQRDVARLSRVLTERGIAHEVLAGTEGPEKRYRTFRRILRGATRVVLGSRSAAFAPVQDLALVICWDEADDLLEEPRAPYPHTRTVLQCRSAEERCALLFLAASESVTMRALTDAGYLARLDPVPAPVTAVRPRIVAMDQYLRDREGPSGRSRLPQEAMRVLRNGLQRGPVLVQVPRTGYAPAIACTFCGTRARCPECAAPLSQRGRNGPLHCTVCGRREDGYRCPECDRTHVRAMVIGSTRTAEELHRAFPDAPLKVAGGAHGPLEDDAVPEHGIVVATPGAEPAPPGRYSACLLLDADAMLGRAAFDADVEAVRRWRGAISLVRTAEEGGEVLVVGTSTLPAIRDLVAHRSALFLDRVLEDRRELDLPPFRRVAEVVGEREACRGFLETTELPDGTEVLGPVDLEGPDQAGRARAVLRIEPRRSRELAAALRFGVAARSARKDRGSLRVRLDPPDVF